jgi:hypothetical protein
MPLRKRRVQIAAAQQRDLHRPALLAVLGLSALLLLINAWLGSHQLIRF